jgi:hypothetical protein
MERKWFDFGHFYETIIKCIRQWQRASDSCIPLLVPVNSTSILKGVHLQKFTIILRIDGRYK